MLHKSLCSTLLILSCLFALSFGYPSRRLSSKPDYMELKVKPKSFQVAIDNPEDVQEMIVKDISNQKRVLIVAKNPAPFDHLNTAPTSSIFTPSSRDYYEYAGRPAGGNSGYIRKYYENASRNQPSGYWQGSVLPASLN